MNTTHETPGADDLTAAPREPDAGPLDGGPLGETVPTTGHEAAPGPKASAKVTVLLVVALWVGITLALAISQVVLNRGLGIDFEFRSLPDVWDLVLTFVACTATWVLVGRRHPGQAPGGPASGKVTLALVAALWAVVLLGLVAVQLLLNRSLGLDLAIGSLPDLWDWVLTIALIVATWVVVDRRHPRADP
jgi:hypothetical protein